MSVSLSSPARLQILLVPVGPIQRAVYLEFAAKIKTFTRIALRDVPPDSRGDRAVLSASPRLDGYLLLSFVDCHSRYTAFLEDFEAHRRLFGIIGVADCQEWDTLVDANIEFQRLARRHPRVASARCYAFNPPEMHRDEVEGLVTIPRVGDTDFYIGTLIADLASTMLYELSNMVAALETRATFPTPRDPVGSATDETAAARGKSASLTSLPSKSSPELSVNGSRHVTSPPPPVLNAGSNPHVNILPPQTHPPDDIVTRSASQPSQSHDTSAFDQDPSLLAATTNTFVRAATPIDSVLSTMSIDKTTKRRMQGRMSKLKGDLYLLAGRWSEALGFYNDALVTAKAIIDPLWESVAAERQLLAVILVAWLPQIPESVAPHTSPRLDLSTIGSRPVAQETAVQALASAREVPDRYHALLQQYLRLSPPQMAPASLDSLPTIILVEACLRCANLQLLLMKHKVWSAASMTDMLEATDARSSDDFSDSRLVMPSQEGAEWTKAGVSECLNWAYAPSLSHLPVPERLGLLSAIASLYGVLGFLRKRAVVLREIAGVACEAMRRARAQAREEQPLSQIVSSTPDVEGNETIVGLLEQICDAHGVNAVARIKGGGPDKRISVIGGQHPGAAGLSDAAGENTDALEDNRFGWPELQIASLRDAITCSELLPDYSSALRFTISALRETSNFMAPLEQLQLSQTIPAILSHAARRGAVFSLGYWGPPNLLVSLEAIPMPADLLPAEMTDGHSLEEKKGPFIYSASSRKNISLTTIKLVQYDMAEFLVTLQNPFMFDLQIQGIELSTSGVQFETSPISCVLPPSSFQVVRLAGRPMEPGNLILRGCLIRLVCSEALEFVLPLAEERRQSLDFSDRPKSTGLHSWRKNKDVFADVPSHLQYLSCSVVPQQPLLHLKTSSLTHGSIVLYDGEQSSIHIVLENTSSLAIEDVRLLCADTHTAEVEERLRSQKIHATDAYELNFALRQHPVFSWKAPEDRLVIAPGAQTLLTVACFGKVGCTGGSIQIEYSAASAKHPGIRLARRLFLDVFMTVHRALEAFTMSIQRLQAPMSAEPVARRPDMPTRLKQTCIDPELEASFRLVNEAEHCLLAIDVRNVYGHPFEVIFCRTSHDAATAQVTQRIEPGATATLLLRIDRLRLTPDEAYCPLPTLADKQFVVSNDGSPADEVEATRELFWYRETLLRGLRATWHEIGGYRHGQISLRSLRLTRPMLDVLKLDEVDIALSVVADDPDSDPEIVQQYPPGRPAYRVKANEFVDIRAAISNSTVNSLNLVARFDTLSGLGRPPESRRSLHEDEVRELERYVVFAGTPWVAHANVPPGQTVSANVQAFFLSAGRFEIGCSAEAGGRLFICRSPLAIEVYS